MYSEQFIFGVVWSQASKSFIRYDLLGGGGGGFKVILNFYEKSSVSPCGVFVLYSVQFSQLIKLHTQLRCSQLPFTTVTRGCLSTRLRLLLSSVPFLPKSPLR